MTLRTLILLNDSVDRRYAASRFIVGKPPHLDVRINAPWRDDSESLYRVLVSCLEDKVEVKEHSRNRRLPTACPERHINRDGTFCLGYGPTFRPAPRTVEEAAEWWGLLTDFLQMQNKAAESGRWPRKSWYHGHAADFQLEFEKLEKTVPENIRNLPQSYEVRRDRLCPCGSQLKVRACHADEIIRLRKLRKDIRNAEAQFYSGWSDVKCCGTMTACGLRKIASEDRWNSVP